MPHLQKIIQDRSQNKYVKCKDSDKRKQNFLGRRVKKTLGGTMLKLWCFKGVNSSEEDIQDDWMAWILKLYGENNDLQTIYRNLKEVV